MQLSIRIALGMIAGILAADWLPFPPALALWAACTLLVFARLRPSQWRTALIAALIGASALSHSQSRQLQVESELVQASEGREKVSLEGWVEGMPLRHRGRLQLLLRTPQAKIWLTVYGEPEIEAALIEPGHRIRVLARLKSPIGLRGLGTADRRRQIMSRGAELVASASRSDLVIVDRRWSNWSVPERVHRWAVQRISSGAGQSEGRAIVAALATGERSLMSDSLDQAVRATGISHLLAVSGMHLAALVALVFWIIRRAWAYSPWRHQIEPRAVAAMVALAAAISFTAMTGARASTTRALLVATFVLLGMILDRRIRLLHALAWSAVLLLLWRPVLLWDVGFQLSFAATTALAIAFSSRETPLRFEGSVGIGGIWRRTLRALRALIRASFWATLATYPITLYHFGEVSWIGLASNLLAVPLTTILILPTALGGLLVAAVWPSAGALVLDFSITLAQCMADFCYWVESILPLVVRAPLNAWELACWALMILALLLRPSIYRPRPRKLLFATAASLLLLSRWVSAPIADELREELRVTFVEIGQGDAAVIETPGGEVYLVDGGGLPFVGPMPFGNRQRVAETPARQALLPYLRHRRIDHIDLAIVSHPHPDHFVGLQAVSRRMPIAEIWTSHTPSEKPGPYEVWLSSLASGGTLVRRPPLGHARSNAGTELHVLWPRYQDPRGAPRPGLAHPDPILTVNDNSIVLRVDFAGRRLLFTGDIEEEAEDLLARGFAEELRVDVLKVPHHGSPTSSTQTFVDATSPALAVISCGRNNHFGFPDFDVEKRWSLAAKQVLRTDEVGSVTLRITPEGEMVVSTNEGF